MSWPLGTVLPSPGSRKVPYVGELSGSRQVVLNGNGPSYMSMRKKFDLTRHRSSEAAMDRIVFPQNSYIEVLTHSTPSNVTIFGDRSLR